MPTATRKAPAAPRRRIEDELLVAVIEHAKRLHLKTYHNRPAPIRPGKWITAVQGDGKGWPDLVIAGKGGQLYRELKTNTGRVEPEQQAWMDELAAGGADVAVWRPRDLHSGRITAELNALRRPRTGPAVGAACQQIDRTYTDAAVYRAALEQIRDMDPTAASSSALLAGVQRLAAEVLAGDHHPAHTPKEALHG